MLSLAASIAIGMCLLLGGCTIAALMGAGRADRMAEARQEAQQAPREPLAEWLKAS